MQVILIRLLYGARNAGQSRTMNYRLNIRVLVEYSFQHITIPNIALVEMSTFWATTTSDQGVQNHWYVVSIL